jgi:hypothetical protein
MKLTLKVRESFLNTLQSTKIPEGMTLRLQSAKSNIGSGVSRACEEKRFSLIILCF